MIPELPNIIGTFPFLYKDVAGFIRGMVVSPLNFKL